MVLWDQWKKGFDSWEAATAKVSEQFMKSPIVLAPAGAVLTAAMKLKAAQDRALADFWGGLGLPTKRDQERSLHLLNTLESRLLDLEEKLGTIEKRS
jgi:hypothetical protein